jgi:hypothetical protein
MPSRVVFGRLASYSLAAVSAAADQALSPFSRPLHHFPWHKTGQKLLLLTGTGERARKVVKGPAGDAGTRRAGPPGGRTSGRRWGRADYTNQST